MIGYYLQNITLLQFLLVSGARALQISVHWLYFLRDNLYFINSQTTLTNLKSTVHGRWAFRSNASRETETSYSISMDNKYHRLFCNI